LAQVCGVRQLGGLLYWARACLRDEAMGCCLSQKVKPSFHKTYKLGAKLGEGGFGQVREAMHISSGEWYAVKIIDLRKIAEIADDPGEVCATASYAVKKITSPALVDARREVAVWRKIGKGDNCVRLLDTFGNRRGSKLFYMVMERCTGGDLMQHLGKTLSAGEQDVSQIFRQMLLGIQQVHSVRLVHRDIKPHNFLLGGEAEEIVKLCDFGSAEYVPPAPHCMDTWAGTLPYMSPEMIGTPCAYRENTDVWSFGITAYILLYGHFPYMAEKKEKEDWACTIIKGERPSFERPGGLPQPSEQATAFVQALLKMDPKERCSVSEALGMEFMSEEELAVTKRKTSKRDLEAIKRTVTDARAKASMVEDFAPNQLKQQSLDDELDRLERISRRSESHKQVERDKRTDSNTEDLDKRVVRSSVRAKTYTGVTAMPKDADGTGSNAV